jgi:hypothetical protein
MAFKLGTLQKRRPRAKRGPGLSGILKVLTVIFLLAAVAAGFVWLDRYVKKTIPVSKKAATVELVDVPAWVSEQLKERVYEAAKAGRANLPSDENTAVSVQQSIESQVAWIADVTVQAMHDGIRIKGRWRKPLALVESGSEKFYIDGDMIVLDSVPMPDLPIVTVSGLAQAGKPPRVGRPWQGDDLSAGVAILRRLMKMDEQVTPDKPLLAKIDRLDVSNFNGRKSARQPHIVLYTKDNTEIIWGAEIGAWQRHLEATDEEKLAKLYAYYEQYGKFSDVKYINLRDPQNSIHLPVDK